MRKKRSSRGLIVAMVCVIILLLLAIGAMLLLVGKSDQHVYEPTPTGSIQGEESQDMNVLKETASLTESSDIEDSVAETEIEISVVNAYINDELHMIKVMSNGTEVDAGYVGGENDSGDSVDTYTVSFLDYNGSVIKTETVCHGRNATPPADPSRSGFVFIGWQGVYTNVTSDQTVMAEYAFDEPSVVRYTVKFIDHDGSLLKTELVEKGKGATAPVVSRPGYSFLSWDKDFSNVTSNLRVTAQYEEIPSNDSVIAVESLNVPAGGTVDLAVTLRNNPGVVGMTLKLDYDERVMTLTAVSQGEALSEMTFTQPKSLGSGCQFPWDAEEVLPEDATNGKILILTFTVPESTEAGTYPIKLTYDRGAIIDNDLKSVDFVIHNGSITVD